jgi:radical SAM superfamily enzyme YgiQ (UPF0313 family)
MAKVILTGGPSFALFTPSLHVSLGLLYLGAALREAGHEVKIVDCHKLTAWDNERGKLIVLKELLEPCDILGVSCVTPNAEFGGQLAATWPAKVKVAGGPHVTYILHGPHKQFKHKKFFQGFDYLMAGECEDSFVQFCNDWEQGKILNVPGFGWFDLDGTIHYNPQPPLPDVLKMPLPAYDLWDGEWGKGGLLVNSQHGKSVDATERTIGSLWTARGCIVAGTLVTLHDGTALPVEAIKVGDLVRGFNTDSSECVSAPVQAVWERDATDVWELKLENGTVLQITGEHPVWSPYGWEEIKDVCEGMDMLSTMSDRVSGIQDQEGNVLFCGMLQSLYGNTRQQTDETNGEENDEGGTVQVLGASSCSYQKGSEAFIGMQERRLESNETSGSSKKSFRNNQEEIQQNNVEGFDQEMEKRFNDDAVGTISRNRDHAKQARGKIGSYITSISSRLSLRWRWTVLDRAVYIWHKTKSGFCRFKEEKSYFGTWRTLAQRQEKRQGRTERLQEIWVEDFYSVDSPFENLQQVPSNTTAYGVWTKVVKKTFVGKAKVYNITVHPVHNYFANGVLVHNCPYGCYFCADARTKLREETPAQVEAEVKWLANHGINSLRIWDDVLTIKAKRCMELVDIFHDYGMLWRGWSRVNLMDPKLFEYMAVRGCTEMGFGVEHGSPRMLKAMNKGTTPEANTIGIKICQDAGIVARAYLLIGFPGETWESIDEMQKWLETAKPDAASLHMFQPYPGSQVWITPERFGIKELPIDAFSKMWELNDDDPSTLILDLDTMTKQELFTARTQLGTWIKDNISMRPANR